MTNPDFARVVQGDPPRQYAYLLKAGDVTVAASDSRAKLEELEAKINAAFRQELSKRLDEEREGLAKEVEEAGIKEECCRCGTKNGWLNPVLIAQAIRSRKGKGG